MGWDWDWIWKAILMVFIGTLLLRIAGRKSISQMTLAQTVIMIAIGSLLIQPVSGKNIWVTFGVGIVLIATLIVIEWLQVKFDFFETFITGKSVVVIENGVIHENNLGKLRMTVDQLEFQLRQHNVASVSDVQYATLEPNGQLGYTLKQKSQPATKEDMMKLAQDIHSLKDYINANLNHVRLTPNLEKIDQTPQDGLFKEVADADKNMTPQPEPPKHLQ